MRVRVITGAVLLALLFLLPLAVIVPFRDTLFSARDRVDESETEPFVPGDLDGGVMLRVLGIVYPVLIALSIVQIAVSFLTAGSVPPDMLYTLAIQAGSWLFFNSGVLFCLARLSAAVHKRKTVKSRYTRVLLPSFLFVPIADLFMILSSLFCGRFLFALLKQDDCSRNKG